MIANNYEGTRRAPDGHRQTTNNNPTKKKSQTTGKAYTAIAHINDWQNT